MKKLILHLAISLTGIHSLYGQTNLTGTYSQAAPAFIIIGAQPKSVYQPETPRALSATLINTFDQKGGIRPDVAMEFSPYWLRDEKKRSLTSTMSSAQNTTLAFSLATLADTFKTAGVTGQNIGLGFRIQPMRKFNPNISNILSVKLDSIEFSNIIQFLSLDPKIEEYTEDILVDKLRSAVYKNKKVNIYIVDQIISLHPKVQCENNKDYLYRLQNVLLPVSALSIDNLYDNEMKTHWEIAGAVAIRFPTNSVDYSRVNRIGIWSNLSRDIYKNNFTLSTTARFIQNFGDSTRTNFDLGLSLTSNFWQQLPVSFEWTGRYYQYTFNDFNQAGQPIRRIESKYTYRLALTSDFAINEDVSLSFTFGRDYDQPFSTSGNLLGILGLNYSFGTKNQVK